MLKRLEVSVRLLVLYHFIDFPQKRLPHSINLPAIIPAQGTNKDYSYKIGIFNIDTDIFRK